VATSPPGLNHIRARVPPRPRRPRATHYRPPRRSAAPPLGGRHRAAPSAWKQQPSDIGRQHVTPCAPAAVPRKHWRTVGSAMRRQTTAAGYSGGEQRRLSPAQELWPRGSRRSRIASPAVVPGWARTVLGRVAADTSSNVACGGRGALSGRQDPPAAGCWRAAARCTPVTSHRPVLAGCSAPRPASGIYMLRAYIPPRYTLRTCWGRWSTCSRATWKRQRRRPPRDPVVGGLRSPRWPASRPGVRSTGSPGVWG
jgi:hypothetical protein